MNFVLFVMLLTAAAALPFSTVWHANSSDFFLELPISRDGFAIFVDWGDGATINNAKVPINHSYLKPNNFTVSITGMLYYFSMDGSAFKDSLLEVKSWGELVIDDKRSQIFAGCRNLVVTASDQPIIASGTSSLQGMFRDCTSFNTALAWDINNATSLDSMFRGTTSFDSHLILTNTSNVAITSFMFSYSSYNKPVILDTRSVTIFDNMFNSASAFNQPVHFDTPNAISMSGMFRNASKFNSVVNFTDTSKVTTMASMFHHAESFNQPVNFNTRSLGYFDSMFADASVFNQPVNFNTSSTLGLSGMFFNASQFNSTVNFTDTSKVTTMASMFHHAESFNQPITFNTQSVKSLSYMFSNALNFNQPISFDIPNATSLKAMFLGSSKFNSTVSLSNTSQVDDMSSMFYLAGAFNQPIDFDTRSVTTFESMFQQASMFNQPVNFDTRNTTSMKTMFYLASRFNSVVNFTATSQVDMSSMFQEAASFNQPITFSLMNVTNADRMFAGTNAFYQDLSALSMPNAINCSDFCLFCYPPFALQCNPCQTRSIQIGFKQPCSCRSREPCEIGNAAIVPYTGDEVLISVLGNGSSPSINITFPANVTNGTLQVVATNKGEDTVSDVVSIVLISDGKTVDVKNLTNLVLIDFPVHVDLDSFGDVHVCDENKQPKQTSTRPLCGYKNENKTAAALNTDGEWRTDGCTTYFLNKTTVRCACTHLTIFAVFKPSRNEDVVPSEVLTLTSANVAKQPIGVIAVTVTLVVFVMLFLLAKRRDLKEAHNEALESAKTEKWRKGKKKTLKTQIKISFQKRHTFFSLIMRKSGTSFQSVDRTFVALLSIFKRRRQLSFVSSSLVFASMSVSASFHAQPNNIFTRPLMLFATACACFLPALVLTELFVHTGEMGFFERYEKENKVRHVSGDKAQFGHLKHKWKAYRFPGWCVHMWRALIMLAVFGMIFYILVMSMRFDLNPFYFCQGKPAAAWLENWLLIYGVTVLAIEPFRIILIAVVAYYKSKAQITAATRRTEMMSHPVEVRE